MPARRQKRAQDPVVLGRAIRELRTERTSLSQEAFASEASLDRAHYASLERGDVNPTLKTLVRVATALDVHLSELFARYEQLGGNPKPKR
jgi:transcriptional regulator with XRE-family HTH domain